MNTNLILEDRILGALWGAVVGDALGVPVEFVGRAERVRDPVISMRGGGTWRQLPGTWSDDSSLMLCTVEGLLNGFDPKVLGGRFVEWRLCQIWTPRGAIFDIGNTTRDVLDRIAEGTPAERAGGTAESSNGNGSLMRILPIALRHAEDPLTDFVEKCHRASAITHRHPRSQMACALYCLIARRLLGGEEPLGAIRAAGAEFVQHYRDSAWSGELTYFHQLTSVEFSGRPEQAIESSGYVLHTLTAALWCLLHTGSFREAALRAVNLGGDTDTTGIVTGGLAGLVYGGRAIPEEWTSVLARHDDLERLFNHFAAVILGTVVAERTRPSPVQIS